MDKVVRAKDYYAKYSDTAGGPLKSNSDISVICSVGFDGVEWKLAAIEQPEIVAVTSGRWLEALEIPRLPSLPPPLA